MLSIQRNNTEDQRSHSQKLDKDFQEYIKISNDYHKVLKEQEKIFYFIERLDKKMNDNKERISSAQYKATRYLDPMQSRLSDEEYQNYLKQKEQSNELALQRLEERKKKYQIYEELKQKYLQEMEEKKQQMEKKGKRLPPPKPLPKMNQPQKGKGSFFFMSNSAQPQQNRQKQLNSKKNLMDDFKLEIENHCIKCQNKIKEKRAQKKQYKEYLLGDKIDDQKLEYVLKQAQTFNNFDDIDKVENEKDLLNCGCDCVKCNPGVPKIQLRNRRIENKIKNNEIRSQSLPKFMLFKTVKGGNQPFIKIDMEHLREQQEKFIQSRHKKSADNRQWKY